MPTIEALFPAGVTVVTATPAMWTGPLYPEEAACIRGAVDKRRREFAAGRQCARAALARLGIDDFPLLVGPQREPLWPPGIVGSISHGAGRCAVVACRAGAVLGLGLDIEDAEPLAAELVPMICTPAERDWCARRSAKHDWPKLLFGIKEAVYKSVFPLLRRTLEFEDVTVAIDAEGRRFVATLVDRVPAEPWLRSVRGRFAWDEGRVIAGATVLRPGAAASV